MKKKHGRLIIALLYLGGIPVMLLALMVGSSGFTSMREIFALLTGFSRDSMIYDILMNVRMPRVFMAFLAGGMLAAGGHALQLVFRNALVSPYVLGLSSGAAFGAAFAIAIGFLPLPLSAFIFAVLATVLSIIAAHRNGVVSVINLILAGIIVQGVFTALLTFVQFVSNPLQLQAIVYWTMGNLHAATWSKVFSALPYVLIAFTYLYVRSWKMNAFLLGQDEAACLGINPQKERFLIIAMVTLGVSAVVSVVGVIAMYGLIIPHMVRMFVHVNDRHSLLLNIVFGGWFMVLVDMLSRSITQYEIPVGIFTILIGAPVFFYLLKKSQYTWSNE